MEGCSIGPYESTNHIVKYHPKVPNLHRKYNRPFFDKWNFEEESNSSPTFKFQNKIWRLFFWRVFIKSCFLSILYFCCYSDSTNLKDCHHLTTQLVLFLGTDCLARYWKIQCKRSNWIDWVCLTSSARLIQDGLRHCRVDLSFPRSSFLNHILICQVGLSLNYSFST